MEEPKYCKIEEQCELRRQIADVYGDADRFCAKYGMKEKGICLSACEHLTVNGLMDLALGTR